MATIKLVASTYSVSNTTVTVSSADNMYTDVSSTNYATITHTTSGTTSYYCYIKGFNFSDVPSNAEVSSIVIRIKGSESGLSTSTTYAPRLYNNTSTITGASTATTNFGASSSGTTITVPYTGTWDTLKGYGANLGIRVTIRRSNRNTQGYLYVYGAEIEVTYTIPVYYDISASGDGTLNPSGTTSVLQGDSYSLKITGISNPTVRDNNIDVTSQVTQTTNVTDVAIPTTNTNSGWYSVENIANAYDDADSTDYASFELAGNSATGTVYLTLSNLGIPSSATIVSVSAKATVQYNRNGSSSGFSSSVQMYSGNTAKGSATSWVANGNTDVAKTTLTLSAGSWTASEIANARLYLTATNSAYSTRRYVYIYGVSFEVTYESDGITYIYTISNVTGNHTIVVTAGAVSNVIWVKQDNVDTLLGHAEDTVWDDSGMPMISIQHGTIVPGDICFAVIEAHTSYGDVNTQFEFTVPAYNNVVQNIQTWFNDQVRFRIMFPSSQGLSKQFQLDISNYYATGYYEVYKREPGGWIPATKVYKKVNGSWVQQTNLVNVFDPNINYVKG